MFHVKHLWGENKTHKKDERANRKNEEKRDVVREGKDKIMMFHVKHL